MKQKDVDKAENQTVVVASAVVLGSRYIVGVIESPVAGTGFKTVNILISIIRRRTAVGTAVLTDRQVGGPVEGLAVLSVKGRKFHSGDLCKYCYCCSLWKFFRIRDYMKGNKFIQPLNCTLYYHLRLNTVKCQFYISRCVLSVLLYTFVRSLPNAHKNLRFVGFILLHMFLTKV